MTTLKIETPITEEEVRRIRIRDTLYISGVAITARDKAHFRAIEYKEYGKELPLNFVGSFLYHCGPLVKKENGKWLVIAAGPTTSMRMESLEYDFIQKFRPRIIVGKGGMGKGTVEAAKKFGAIYCEFTGGAAVLAAKAICGIQNVYWLDLGTPEALWVLNVKEFGPLIVTIDSEGNSLYDNLMRKIRTNKSKILSF